MLSLFRTNQILNGILLLPYAVLLYASVMFFGVTPPEAAESSGVLAEIVYNLVGERLLLSQIIAVLLLWMQSFMINGIVLTHRLQDETNIFPGLFYILLCCLLPDFLYLSPVLTGNTFFIAALAQMMKCYGKQSMADRIFNVGFWLGTAGLFYFSFNYLLLWAFAGLASLRSFKMKENMQTTAGLLTVWIISGTIYYWNGEFGYFWHKQFSENVAFWDFENTDNYAVWVKGGIIGATVIAAGLFLDSFQSKKVMQIQRKITVLFRVFVIAVPTMLFQAGMSIEHLLIFMVPLSFFVSFWFTNMKNNIAEALHLLLLTGILFYQYSGMMLG